MKIIELKQRTPEWKAWRREGISATDSSVILRRNPYQTPWRLWCEKTGKFALPDLSNNPAVQNGVDHEDDARRLFIQRHQTCVIPCCAEGDDPIFRASFDGLTPENRPVEIKCPYFNPKTQTSKTWDDVMAHGLKADAVQMYAIQVQHQIYVAGADKGWLLFYNTLTGELLEFEILRDDALINEILAEGRKFYECLVKKIEPPMDRERDLFIPAEGEDRTRWIAAARDFAQVDQEIEALTKRLKELEAVRQQTKATLVELMGNHLVADFAGVTVTRSMVKGRVDYKQLYETQCGKSLSEDEVDALRTPSKERWMVSRTETDLPERCIDADLKESIERCDVGESLYW